MMGDFAHVWVKRRAGQVIGAGRIAGFAAGGIVAQAEMFDDDGMWRWQPCVQAKDGFNDPENWIGLAEPPEAPGETRWGFMIPSSADTTISSKASAIGYCVCSTWRRPSKALLIMPVR